MYWYDENARVTFISKDICAVQLVEKKTIQMCYPSLVQVQEETLDCGKNFHCWKQNDWLDVII